MKKTTKQTIAIILLSLSLCFADNLFSQTAKIDSKGNYVAAKKTATKSESKETGKTFTDSKGNIYPVYESINGKLFYYKTSKTGNVYKVYLKIEG
jgi:uncharacterized protein YxeA